MMQAYLASLSACQTRDVTSEDDEAHSSVPEDNDEEEEEEENNPPPEERRKKRAASAHLETERPRRGRASQRSILRGTLTAVRNDAPALSPRPHRK